MWNVQVRRASKPLADKAIKKYSDQIKKETGHRVRVTYGMLLDMLLEKYMKEPKP